MTIELTIINGTTEHIPPLEGAISWETAREGTPGKLTFTVVKAGGLSFQEGNAVRLLVDGAKVFYGFIFSKKRSSNGLISVTAYDQIIYLKKNKNTYIYTDKTAADVLRMICGDFELKTGLLASPAHKMSRIEDGQTLLDIIQTALDTTLANTKKMYVLYDNFGKLELAEPVQLDILIDADTAQDFDYESSIDKETYNVVKLVKDNAQTGKREAFVIEGKNIDTWGILQFYEKVDEKESDANIKAKASAYLNYYNRKSRTLMVSGVIGDIRARAGQLVMVMLNLGDIEVGQYMLIESAKHAFEHEEHFMTLTLKGGSIQ